MTFAGGMGVGVGIGVGVQVGSGVRDGISVGVLTTSDACCVFTVGVQATRMQVKSRAVRKRYLVCLLCLSRYIVALFQHYTGYADISQNHSSIISYRNEE